MPKIPVINPNKSLSEQDAERKKLAALDKANPSPVNGVSGDAAIKEEVEQRKLSKRYAKRKEPERPILYQTPYTILCIGDGSIEGTKPAVTCKKMKELLNYETEDQWKERVKKETNDVQEAAALCVAGYGDDFLFKNLAAQKVRCWNNTKNRPFNLSHAKEIGQEILNSGPGLPKEKRRWQFNGESFIVGDRAQVISGQHRGIGFIWAVDEWKKDPDKWKTIWPTEPTLDTVLVFGVPELPYVLRTIDNVLPRSLSDVFYTSPLFAGMNNREKEECSRSLMNAVDLLWTRTGVTVKYQTHGESVEFLDRHPKLLACVKHLFGENKDRAISLLKLSPGRCAALMYLFATSKSSAEKYAEVKHEKALDWSMWEKAQLFFSQIGNASNPLLGSVREVIGEIYNADKGEDGLGGRQVEKHAVLCKAWNLFCDDAEVSVRGIRLSYAKNANDELKLLDKPTVGGIDKGESISDPKEAASPEPTPDEVAAEKAKIDKQRVADMEAKIKAANKKK